MRSACIQSPHRNITRRDAAGWGLGRLTQTVASGGFRGGGPRRLTQARIQYNFQESLPLLCTSKYLRSLTDTSPHLEAEHGVPMHNLCCGSSSSLQPGESICLRGEYVILLLHESVGTQDPPACVS